MSAFVQQWFDSASDIVLDSALWLLAGFLLAGVFKVLADRGDWLERMLARKGSRSVWLAALLGAPMPLCSCSVLPAALGLRRQGASRGATASFLVSVPETDVVSVALTWALLGPMMAIARPVAALFTAIGTGLVLEAVPQPDQDEPITPPSCESGCGDPEEAKRRAAWLRALRYGFVEFFDDIAGPLVLGLAMAATVSALAANYNVFAFVGHPIGGYLTALLVGIPTYVCATASTPVAVGLLAAGMSPGAVLVFLLAGPATNVASFVVLGREFGRRGLLVYLAGIIVGSVVFGLAFDLGFSQDTAAAVQPMPEYSADSPLRMGAAAVLGLMIVLSAVRAKWYRRLLAWR